MKKGVEMGNEQEWQGAFSFVHLTDCQFGMFTGNVSWEKEKALLARALEEINQLQPRFVVMGGDMTHAFPGEAEHAVQLKDVKEVMKGLDEQIPVVYVCGNHDVGHPITLRGVEGYGHHFGADRGVFWVGGVRVLHFNSTLYFLEEGEKERRLEQESWLKEQLLSEESQRARFRLVFTHYPWFTKELGERDSHLNIPLSGRMEGVDLLLRAQVKACFSGHLHQNFLAKVGELELVTTGAIGMPMGGCSSGYRFVTVREDGLDQVFCPVE